MDTTSALNGSESLLVGLCSRLYPSLCCHQMIDDLNLFEESCFKTVVSKTLGYGIIMGSTLVKLPQLLKIVSSASGAGLSFAGVLMELLAMTFAVAYAVHKQFPFSAWGESLFLLVVTAGIAFFILFYDDRKSYSVFFVVSYASVFYLLVAGITPYSVLWSLQATNMPLVLLGKLMQALTNYKNGHTGQLSAITISLLLAGAVVRIFTSIQETGDTLVVLTFIAASLANAVLLTQLVYYWERTNQFLTASTLKKKN